MGLTVVYGFSEFGEVRSNPSALLIERLWETHLKGEALFRTLPVAYAQAAKELRGIFREHDVECVVGFGVAAGEHAVRLESHARNATDSGRKDVNGTPPPAKAVVAGGAKHYATAFDLARLQEALTRQGVPSRISDDAGRYLCNYSYYLVSHLLAEGGGGKRPRSLFVHLPLQPSESARLGSVHASMELEMMERAAMTILEHAP